VLREEVRVTEEVEEEGLLKVAGMTMMEEGVERTTMTVALTRWTSCMVCGWVCV
jgi:hypothetical protein